VRIVCACVVKYLRQFSAHDHTVHDIIVDHQKTIVRQANFTVTITAAVAISLTVVAAQAQPFVVSLRVATWQAQARIQTGPHYALRHSKVETGSLAALRARTLACRCPPLTPRALDFNSRTQKISDSLSNN
jgi:hypothetical protein